MSSVSALLQVAILYKELIMSMMNQQYALIVLKDLDCLIIIAMNAAIQYNFGTIVLTVTSILQLFFQLIVKHVYTRKI